jgi:hypothetical protein
MALRRRKLLSLISILEVCALETDPCAVPRMESLVPLPLHLELSFLLPVASFERVSSLLGFDPGAGGHSGGIPG